MAWKSARVNIFHVYAMTDLVHYRMGYQIAENIKYLLSKLGDRRLLGELSGLGCTALGSAALHGNDVVVKTLLDAGVDPNAGLAQTPLKAALEWLEKCRTREQRAARTTKPGEKRQSVKLRRQAEETVRLLQAAGAIAETRYFNPATQLANGNFQFASASVRSTFTMQSSILD
jgi:hypothetical protein